MNSRLYSLFLILLFLISCSFQKVQSTSTNLKPIKNEIEDSIEIDNDIEKEIWVVESGGHNIRLTSKDIYLKTQNGYKSLFLPIITKYYEKNWKYKFDYKKGKSLKTEELDLDCPVELDTKVKSVIDKYLILEIEFDSYCRNVDSLHYFTQWLVVDLDQDKPISLVKNKYNEYEFKRNVSIFKFFSDKQILNAILENNEVKWVFNETKLNPNPKSTLELIKWFEKMSKDAQDGKHDYGWDTFQFDGHVHSLTKDSLKNFTFEVTEDNKVLIYLALSPYSRMHRVPHIKLVLDIPEKHRISFILSKIQKEGFIQENNLIGLYFDEKKQSNK